MKKVLLAVSAALVVSLAQAGQSFSVDGPCQVYFSPRGGVTRALVDLIGSAKQSVQVLAYNFTSKLVGEAIIAAHQRGVAVELVLDKSVPGEGGGLLPEMLSAGVPTWIDRRHRIAHNKVIIIDGAIFETGSFNYTTTAESNNGENALICPSAAGAAAYLEDFRRHQGHSEVAQ